MDCIIPERKKMSEFNSVEEIYNYFVGEQSKLKIEVTEETYYFENTDGFKRLLSFGFKTKENPIKSKSIISLLDLYCIFLNNDKEIFPYVLKASDLIEINQDKMKFISKHYFQEIGTAEELVPKDDKNLISKTYITFTKIRE